MRPRALAVALAFVGLPAAAQDLVSWKTFSQVQITRTQAGFAPQFSGAVASLDQKEVRIQGFMLPLDMGEKHALFILSAVPPTCSFCMPGGPEAVVEVRAKSPVGYTDNPVTVAGKLSVLRADPTGIFYRLTEAVPSK